jgi:arylsulfatase A-like enzyme
VRRPPNILLLAADSLRADRLDPRIAPNLSRLAARGTRFERAYVSIPRTFPSWVTILTGRHAHHHGIRSMFPTWDERARDFDALPARLAQAGYATGVVSDYAGDIFGRIELGFARVDTPSFDFRQLIRQRALERETPLLPILHSQLGRRLFPVMRERSDAADPMLLAEDAGAALHAMKDKPFFLTVFFSTTHFPYAAPAPYYAKYTDPAYRGRFKYHKPVGLGADAAPDAADVAQIRALYDGAVSSVDDAVARVLGSLEREGLAEDTIIVLTADHGETLYDHGHATGHGDHLFGDEGTHVPLVVYDPRVANGRGAPRSSTSKNAFFNVEEPAAPREQRCAGIARDVDIAPTLYELAGVAPPPDLDGRSLAPALRGQPLEPRFAYGETELWFTEEIPGLSAALRMPYPGIVALTELDSRHNAEIVMRREMVPVTRMARHRMVRDDRWKLVYVPTRKGVKYMLFDTVADPGETQDLAASKPDEVTRLRTELWAWMLRDSQMEQMDGFLVPRLAGGTP